jgi:hypothetical protein
MVSAQESFVNTHKTVVITVWLGCKFWCRSIATGTGGLAHSRSRLHNKSAQGRALF